MSSSVVKKALLAGLILASVLLGACTRSASTQIPTTTPALTPGEENWQQATMDAVRQAVMQTQTAQAGGATSVPPSDTPETPEPPTPTSSGAEEATPTVGVTPAPTSSGGGGVPDTYTLQEGEFPYCIARRFDINPEELLSFNGITGTTTVGPGTTLRIPQDADPFPPPRALHPHPGSYTVRTGDTIYKVACYFGDASPEAIAAANNLSSPYTLTPGAVISIP
jgi:LysM repeat protein